MTDYPHTPKDVIEGIVSTLNTYGHIRGTLFKRIGGRLYDNDVEDFVLDPVQFMGCCAVGAFKFVQYGMTPIEYRDEEYPNYYDSEAYNITTKARRVIERNLNRSIVSENDSCHSLSGFREKIAKSIKYLEIMR